MKKDEKGKKKLEVKKEKVRPLTDDDLDNVAGGGVLTGFPLPPDFSKPISLPAPPGGTKASKTATVSGTF